MNKEQEEAKETARKFFEENMIMGCKVYSDGSTGHCFTRINGLGHMRMTPDHGQVFSIYPRKGETGKDFIERLRTTAKDYGIEKINFNG